MSQSSLGNERNSEGFHGTKVEENQNKNRTAVLSGLVLSVALISAFVYGYSKAWGFLPLFWIGLFAVLMVVFLVGRLFNKGGFAQARCPQCNTMLHFTNPERARTVQCEACKSWSAGTEYMSLISPDHVAEEPVFEVELGEGPIGWPTLEDGSRRCSTCTKVATSMVQIQGVDAVGDLVGMVSPISIDRVKTMKVPSCGEHKDGLLLDATGSELTLCFRSYSYYQEFLRLNPPDAG
ncbi:MAG: hypothetical protein EP343_18285 [Deltaproteobacteria bacterium]|nr:MAG: hypothetical protein EP343_18285 [Deltaproteobacteria bacterium]